MGSLKTVLIVFVLPIAICLGTIFLLSSIGHILPKHASPVATQTIAAPTAIVIAPSAAMPAPTARSFPPEDKKTGDMTGEPMDQLQGCISMALLVGIIAIVIFAGPLQKMARQ